MERWSQSKAPLLAAGLFEYRGSKQEELIVDHGFKVDETFELECKALVLAIAFLGLSKILRSSLMEAAMNLIALPFPSLPSVLHCPALPRVAARAGKGVCIHWEAVLDVTKRRDAAGLERQCGVVLARQANRVREKHPEQYCVAKAFRPYEGNLPIVRQERS